MLDERTAILLKIINEKCNEGCFQIISLDDFILEFPTRYGADGELIRQSLQSLSVGGYIIIKYDQGGEFCLSPTPKGRLYFENKNEALQTQNKPIIDLLPYLYNFLTVFFAVFLSVLLLYIIGVV